MNVTDADREAGEAWRRDYGRKGSYQDLLQAFARHREQARREALEEAANMIDAAYATATHYGSLAEVADRIRALIGETT